MGRKFIFNGINGMKLDPQTVGSAVILFIVAMAFLFGVLYRAEPDITKKEDGKTFSVWRALLYAAGGSTIFTILTVIVSLEVDQQYARKRKMLARLNAAT
jgi:hypothetical protein